LHSSIKKEYDADMSAVPQIMEFVEEMCEGLPDRAAFDITLCCEEIIVNVASYAYRGEAGRVGVGWTTDTDKRRVTVVFEDTGVPFNPLLGGEPDLSVPILERKVGGLGIMMVRKRMDNVEYAYSDGKNVLTLTKNY
jgi:anti-sigma regulatory factor (Ser/Thr protein kinase)